MQLSRTDLKRLHDALGHSIIYWEDKLANTQNTTGVNTQYLADAKQEYDLCRWLRDDINRHLISTKSPDAQSYLIL